jgi:hypothetical protein
LAEERLMKMNQQEKSVQESPKDVLERFILNNPDLERLEDLLAQFNIFETLKIVDAEIRHSNVLAWLLDPKLNHGLGDYFIRKFLKYVVSNNKSALETDISLFDFEALDYSKAEVRRESQNIDLLIILDNKQEERRYVIAIENKIGSAEHGSQLSRYKEIIAAQYRDFKRIFIYLTPGKVAPNEDTDWITFDHGIIADLLDDVIRNKSNTLNEHVLNFISHYVTILRRYIVGESEVHKICQQIYKQHKQALDIIFEHKPDLLLDISEYLIEKVSGQKGELIPDDSVKSYIRFSTPVLDNRIKKISENWTSSKRILLFEFDNSKNRLFLKLLIGPGDQEYRKKLLEFFRKDQNFFRRSRLDLRKSWHTVYTNEFLSGKDMEEGDFSEIRSIVDKKFKEFMDGDLIKINCYFSDNWKEQKN